MYLLLPHLLFQSHLRLHLSLSEDLLPLLLGSLQEFFFLSIKSIGLEEQGHNTQKLNNNYYYIVLELAHLHYKLIEAVQVNK